MKQLHKLSLILFISILATGCGSGDRTVSGTTPVRIIVTEVTRETGPEADQLSGAVRTLDLASAVEQEEGESRQLSLCRFTITGSGMTAIVRDVNLTGKTLISETFNIPKGTNRKILIQMFVEHDDKAVFQASRDGINLMDTPVELEMNLEATAEYFQPPSFGGIQSVSNAETRSVRLSWQPATDNITPHERIQYLIFLSTESIGGREDMLGEFINTYSLGKGSVIEGDALMSYEYDGDTLLLISYEYEGALPAAEGTITAQPEQAGPTGRLKPGMPYYFIVKAMDEWGNVEGNYRESEEVVVYMLDVAVEGSGTVTSFPAGINCNPKCSEDFLRGTAVTLTAEAGEGGAFEGWAGEEQCGGTGQCSVILDEDTPTITAIFCQSTRYYNDTDGDGYGNAAIYVDSCSEPDQDSYVNNDDDCDDNDPNINPDAVEFCGNEIDENCDGHAEADCICNDGDRRSCGSDTGECESGIESCVNRGWSGDCVNETGPANEICDGLDNDCDGISDEGCECTSGTTRPCGTNTGECLAGTETCINGQWSNVCAGETGPANEVCDGLDNDCDGISDEGCECTSGTTRPCGTNTGECVAGTETCINGQWSNVCAGETGPTNEICDGKDNDCDGVPDGSENLTRTCGTSDVGECSFGTETCNDSGNWVNCDAAYPSKEICSDSKDNDCDGKTDCADKKNCRRDPTCDDG